MEKESLDSLEEESWEMSERENLREWWWRHECWEGEEPGPHLPLHQLGLALPARELEERDSLEKRES